MYKNVKKKVHFLLYLMLHLTVQSRSAPEGALERASNDALSNLHKDAKEGAFEFALKSEFEVPLGFHLWLHLLMQSLIYKSVQNGSFISIYLLFVSFRSNLLFFNLSFLVSERINIC